MHFPPGPLYIARRLPNLLIRFIGGYVSIKLVDKQLGTCTPTWVIVTATLLAVPTVFFLGKAKARYANRKAASRLGAELMPHIEEEWPAFGGFSVMKRLVECLKTGYPGDILLEWSKKYGYTYELRFLTDSRIVTFEPDHVKAMLATQFENFDKGSIFRIQFDSLLGTGVFNSDGDMWKFHRAMTRPFFTRERISDFDIFDSHATDALEQAKARLTEGYAFDFQDLVARFTLDSATQFLFDYDVQSLSAGLAYPENSGVPNTPEFLDHPSNVFVNAFLAGQYQSAYRTRLGENWPLAEFWKNEVKANREVVDRYVEPLLNKTLAERKAKDDVAGEKSGFDEEQDVTLLQHLISHTQDATIIKDELVNLLVAGRDTTASLLTFAFYMLAEYPEIANRLRDEVIGRVGTTNRPTFDDMREMKYLRAFINEVLRLYPPVPFDSRMSINETVWHSKTPGTKPYYIPANTRILYGVFYMHRRADLWGPDALEFDPDRFLDERLAKYLIPNPFIFCPFNAGPRICLGQQFAYHEASFFLVRLVQQFTNFRLAPDAQPESSKPPKEWAQAEGRKAMEKIWPSSHLTLYAKGGLWVKMDEIKANES